MDGSLFPGLSDVIGEVIVASLPRWTYPSLRLINRAWFRLIRSGSVYAVRKRLNRRDTSVLMLPLLSPSAENLTLEVFLRHPDKKAELDEENTPCTVLASMFPFDRVESSFARKMISECDTWGSVQAILCGTSVFMVGHEVWRHDMCSGLCSREPSLLIPRTAFAWVVIEDCIYIIGGRSAHTKQWLGSIECYSTNPHTKGTQMVQDFQTVVQAEVGNAETCEIWHWVYGESGFPILWLKKTRTAVLFGACTEEGLSITIQPSASIFAPGIHGTDRLWLFEGRHPHVFTQDYRSIDYYPELEDLLKCPLAEEEDRQLGGLYWEFFCIEENQARQIHVSYEYTAVNALYIYECHCPDEEYISCSKYSIMAPELFVTLGHMPHCLIEEIEMPQNDIPWNLPAPQAQSDWRFHSEHGIVLITLNYCPTCFVSCLVVL